MNSIIILGICIVIAAIIIVVGYGYFSARSSIGCQIGEPNCVKNFISSTTMNTTSVSTSTTLKTTTTASTTIPYETVVQITTGLPSLGTQTVHVTGTFAWENVNKTGKSGYYVITDNNTALGNYSGGTNDSLTIANNRNNAINLTNISRNFCFFGTAFYPNMAWCELNGDTVFTGRNYTFTGMLYYNEQGGYILNYTSVNSSSIH